MNEIVKKDVASTLKRHRTEKFQQKVDDKPVGKCLRPSTQVHIYVSMHTQTHQQLKNIMPLVPSMDGQRHKIGVVLDNF